MAMSWTPDPRPDWVAAVNRGDAGPVVDEARRPFDPDLLMAEALVRQGRAPDDWAALGDDDFMEPLILFCHGLEHEADLTVMGRWMSRRMILRLLEVRIQLNDYLAADPDTLERAHRPAHLCDRRPPHRHYCHARLARPRPRPPRP